MLVLAGRRSPSAGQAPVRRARSPRAAAEAPPKRLDTFCVKMSARSVISRNTNWGFHSPFLMPMNQTIRDLQADSRDSPAKKTTTRSPLDWPRCSALGQFYRYSPRACARVYRTVLRARMRVPKFHYASCRVPPRSKRIRSQPMVISRNGYHKPGSRGF